MIAEQGSSRLGHRFLMDRSFQSPESRWTVTKWGSSRLVWKLESGGGVVAGLLTFCLVEHGPSTRTQTLYRQSSFPCQTSRWLLNPTFASLNCNGLEASSACCLCRDWTGSN